MNPLKPFRATGDVPWNPERAAHLARRAGFGVHGDELEQLVALGPEAAVDRFVDHPEVDETLEEELDRVGPALDVSAETQGEEGAAAAVDRLRRWWVYRMVRGSHPLQEKLTLFWHDHFACQSSKVIRMHLMRDQNQTFRRLGAGPFRELVRGMARDPAMLVFLDNRLSEKGKPNENWARELLELFTLGVDRYSQRDITELARVFTGWTTPAPHVGRFAFDAARHDTGDKQVFGATLRGRAGPAGEEEGDEAIDLILARDDCPRFLARKLLRWFATDAPPEPVVEELAGVLRANDLSVREGLRALFRSAWFQSDDVRFAHYKTPIDLMAGACRALDLQNPHLAGLEEQTVRMGLELLEPPSVAGWEHGDAWVRTGSAAPRLNFALALSEVPHAGRPIVGRATLDLDALADEAERRPETAPSRALVRSLAARLVERPLDVPQEDAVVACLDALGEAGGTDKERRRHRRTRVRTALHLVLSAPQIAVG